MIDWADVVFVMESKHRDIIKERFTIPDQPVSVLESPTTTSLETPKLIEILRISLTNYL
jgi:predicted protein tyrosine phosphatase